VDGAGAEGGGRVLPGQAANQSRNLPLPPTQTNATSATRFLAPTHPPDRARPKGGDGGDVRHGVEEAEDGEGLHLGFGDGGDFAHADRPEQEGVEGAEA
jgi:hypothetical protein